MIQITIIIGEFEISGKVMKLGIKSSIISRQRKKGHASCRKRTKHRVPAISRSFFFGFDRFVLKASWLDRVRCLPAHSWLCKQWFDWFVLMHHPFGLVKPDRLASGEGGSRADATRDLSCVLATVN